MNDDLSRRSRRSLRRLKLIAFLASAAALCLLSVGSLAAVGGDRAEGRDSAVQCQTTRRSPRPRLVVQTPADRVANAPLLFQEYWFDASKLAEAVNHFVALGEDAAVEELMALAADINLRGRIGWVCRVLFIPRGRKPLRPPMYGGYPFLPVASMPLERWPLFPVVRSGSTYFVLGEGYVLGGFPESAQHYITYCRENGTFRRKPVKVPGREQALKDFAALRRSKAWKAIGWPGKSAKENETWRESQLEPFIQEQAESIPFRKSYRFPPGSLLSWESAESSVPVNKAGQAL
jgi:hypothetical protein